MGAWVEDGNVTPSRAGQAIGAGTSGKPSILSTAYARRAEHSPLELARALIACFQSFAANFLLDDFRVTQFTLDGKGHIYLVDGPKVLHNSSLGDQVYDVWGTRHNQEDNTVRNCASDGDCPATHRLHSCLDNGELGRPRARGNRNVPHKAAPVPRRRCTMLTARMKQRRVDGVFRCDFRAGLEPTLAPPFHRRPRARLEDEEVPAESHRRGESNSTGEQAVVRGTLASHWRLSEVA